MSRFVGLASVAVIAVVAFGRPAAAQQPTKEVVLGWFNEARKLHAAGDFGKAAPLFEKVLRETPRVWGEGSESHASVLLSLGSLYRDMGRLAESEPLCERSLSIRMTKLGKDHIDTAQALGYVAILYRVMGRYAEAEPLQKQSLAVYEAKRGTDHVDTVQALNNLALLYRDMGRYSEAEPLYRRSLTICESKLGKDNISTATALNNLGLLYQQMSRFAEAEPMYRRSLAIYESQRGKDHAETAVSINNLAFLFRDTGKYAESEPLYRRSLAIFEAKLGPDHPSTALSLANIANLFVLMGRFAEAEPLYRRSLAIREARLGKEHPDTAQALNNLGILYRITGRYAEAEDHYRRGLAIREARLAKDHPDTASSLVGLAQLYQITGRYAEAEPLFQRSLTINEARLGKDHPATASSLSNLASLLQVKRRYDEAEPLFQRNLTIIEAKLGKDHPSTASALASLAALYVAKGRFAEAEPLYKRSLAINEAKAGKDHPSTAQSLSNLAGLYWYTGRYAESEPLFQRALAIRRARFGKGHPSTIASLMSTAILRSFAGRHAEAVRVAHQALQLDRAHQVKTLVGLSDADQLNYLKESARFNNSLTIALAAPLNEENAARSAAWLINGKAVAQQTIAERLLLARAALSEEARKKVAELTSVRQELAALTLNPDKREAAEARRLKEELTEKERMLSAELHLHNQRGSRDDPWIELDELTRRLPPKAVYVDYVHYFPVDFKSIGPDAKPKKKPARYAAWVTTAVGEVRVVDLGPAADLDAAVGEARKALDQSVSVINDKGEPDAEAAVRRPLQRLADRVLKPIQEQLDAAEGWVVCPDGQLWLVPWAALPLDDKTYAVEKHPIRLVVSGRDLVLDPLRLDLKAGPPLVVADPDFDFGLPGASQSPPRPRNEAPDQRGLLSGLKLGRVQRLPGTAIEAEAVAERLTAAFGKPRVLTEGHAAAAAVRAAVSPSVLVLATHGFFLPEPPSDDKARAVENPLLRCGLLLAGCNHAREVKDGQDTGVLTGMDVVGLDLRGTKQVVLSACETGLGEVRNGEGVAGLRQAFMLAGAESVLASLWKVPDRDTALLMSAYWDGPADRDRAEGLRQAQMKRIAERRDKFGAAHPYFWAAFTLTGR